MHSANVGRQLESHLPGLGPEEFKQDLQPHQMTPDQFANHPHAVFHTTHLADPFDRDYTAEDGSEAPKAIHVGTYAAALERHGTTGKKSEAQEGWTRDANLHVWHATPAANSLPREVTDATANLGKKDLEYRLNQSIPKTLYYQNMVESPGSTSALVATDHLKSQHDYVTAAIANGKGDEVPASTMARYKAGNLSVWKQPIQDSIAKVGSATSTRTSMFHWVEPRDSWSVMTHDEFEINKRENAPHAGPDHERLGIEKNQLFPAWIDQADADRKRANGGFGRG